MNDLKKTLLDIAQSSMGRGADLGKAVTPFSKPEMILLGLAVKRWVAVLVADQQMQPEISDVLKKDEKALRHLSDKIDQVLDGMDGHQTIGEHIRAISEGDDR